MASVSLTPDGALTALATCGTISRAGGTRESMIDQRDPTEAPDPAETRPAAMCVGLGHVLVYGNPAFVATFGRESVGLPAREALIDLPSAAFDLLDTVLRQGRPLARWIRIAGEEWRLTVAPRVEAGTAEVYGVSFHLRARSDVPVLAAQAPAGLSTSA